MLLAEKLLKTLTLKMVWIEGSLSGREATFASFFCLQLVIQIFFCSLCKPDYAGCCSLGIRGTSWLQPNVQVQLKDSSEIRFGRQSKKSAGASSQASEMMERQNNL